MFSFEKLTLLALLTSAMAFKIPPGTADGVYRVSVGRNGTASHEKIADIRKVGTDWDFLSAIKDLKGIKNDTDGKTNGTINSPVGHLSERSIGPQCNKEGAHVQLPDIFTAAHSLGEACNLGGSKYVPGNGHQYALAGTAVAYVCNYWGWTSRSCDSATCYYELNKVEQACPAGGAGES